MTKIIWHMHHLVPRHAGGTDDKSNLLKCNIAMHAFLHEQRYRDYSDEYDNIAAKCLRGQITNQEANLLANIESGRRMGKIYGPKRKGKTLSDKTKAKMSATFSDGRRKGKNNPMYGKNAFANKSAEEMAKIKAKQSTSNKGKNDWIKGRKHYYNPITDHLVSIYPNQIPEYEANGYENRMRPRKAKI